MRLSSFKVQIKDTRKIFFTVLLVIVFYSFCYLFFGAKYIPIATGATAGILINFWQGLFYDLRINKSDISKAQLRDYLVTIGYKQESADVFFIDFLKKLQFLAQKLFLEETNDYLYITSSRYNIRRVEKKIKKRLMADQPW